MYKKINIADSPFFYMTWNNVHCQFPPQASTITLYFWIRAADKRTEAHSMKWEVVS
jgi:hypothetical protein